MLSRSSYGIIWSLMAKRIVLNPKIMLGKPVFQGTRIPVYLVLDLLADGLTSEQIIKDYYQDLTKEDVEEALKYADRLVRSEEIVFTK